MTAAPLVAPLFAPVCPRPHKASTSRPTPHPLDVRDAVFAAYPEAAEHPGGTTFDLPDGSILSQRADGAWTLLSSDGSTAVQLRTLPQLNASLRERLMVIPARVLPLLEEIDTQQGGVLQPRSEVWRELMVQAERLGLVERAAPWAWRLTARGEAAASAHRSAAFVAVFAL